MSAPDGAAALHPRPGRRPRPAAPATVTLHGERCLLRPFRPDELDELLAARTAVDRSAFAGPRQHDARPREQLRRRIGSSGRVHDGWLEFAVESGGRLVGDVQARSGRKMLPPGVWELGIELYASASRGKGIGTEAVTLITGHLFSALGAGRVQATTDVANESMRGVLRKLGFAEEGVLRSFMPDGDPDGPRHDYVLAAVTAEEWTAARFGRCG